MTTSALTPSIPLDTSVTCMASRSLLSIDKVSVAFGGVKALSNVSIDIPADRGIDAIIGPNGAGKTTLFNALTGVVRPNHGRVLLQGNDITGLRQDDIYRRGLSRTFQGVRLFEHLNIEQNVLLAARSVRGQQERTRGKLLPGWWESAESRERAHAALDRVGLAVAMRRRRPSQLTLWESRMVEIARALSSEPAVLLLDEPAAGLNAVEKARLGDLLLRIVAETGCHLVIVEHDMTLLMSIAEHVWVLNFGSLLASGTPAQVQADPLVHEAYLGSPKEGAR
ncbi:ABC transporter ATP-binding protein [Paraburkholderia sp. BL10I2N1]|uniref:ABC transporter ATP-binding protein n=1 Tax=unclassified Paraburkholderia TaxID=2615204 RepID=UPI001061520F|nr:ABC transporter ATP-binding protein [Paraburkholderia sp. BL10I2N1]TDN62364.1 branched-chain amino acid transport system ATP-binding protein [Paraburkholderia sp. BL10I2N1]